MKQENAFNSFCDYISSLIKEEVDNSQFLIHHN